MCSVAAGPLAGSVGDVGGETAGEEDQGRTSEEEEGGGDSNYDRQVIIFQNVRYPIFQKCMIKYY